MKKRPRWPSPLTCALLSSLLLPQHAPGTPLALSTAPAGTGFKRPAPNVIVSVDDSASMGATGMQTLRDALLDSFSVANVPDGSIRLGWQSMARCFAIPSGGDCANHNMLRVLDSVQRDHFKAWVGTLAARSGTPSHRMLFNAGEYLRMAPGVESPWARVPGTTQHPMLSCRRSYNLFMTDGGWNSPLGNQNGQPGDSVRWDASHPAAAGAIRNADGTASLLGDGTTAYDPTDRQMRIYRDNFGAGLYADAFGSDRLPTFADLAFYYWATDLQPALANNVPRRIAHEGDETFNAGGNTQVLSEFWNPRNDPATWQHLTLYTVGFNGAANWAGTATPVFGTDTWTGGDFARLIVGGADWTDPITGNETTRMPELWHAALNSRGKFIPAPTAASLSVAFRDVLNSIITDPTSALASLAGSSYLARSDSLSFEAGYSADAWHGAVTAYGVAATTGAVSTTGAWGTAVAAVGDTPARPVSTATLLDASGFDPASRRVLSHDGTGGILWTWANLAASQKAALHTLGTTSDTRGEDRLAYLRGDRTREVRNGGTFRNRKSRHGDIVNSRLWVAPGKPSAGYSDSSYSAFRSTYAGRASMLYVGANDGMLHGFAAADGTEQLAYVPGGLHGTLSQLTSVSYEHRYYVDGSPLTGDIQADGRWKTYLAGFLGAGGPGYFVLDVTDPSAFASAAPASLVVMDKTGPAVDADVGSMVSQPVMEPGHGSLSSQIAQLNNGRWALVMGNGYNSANQKAVLLIQYLDGDKSLVKIDTGVGAGTGDANGLGAPRLIDLNGDRKPDIAYAGDLKGNLWKFDLSGDAPTDWKLAFGGSPLYVARDSASRAQPITAAPVWLPHPAGGVMVVFGTGRNLTNADRADTAVQSLYGVYDRTTIHRDPTTHTVSLAGGTAITEGRALLVAQTLGAIDAGVSDGAGRPLGNFSSNTVNFAGADAKSGWYFDLPMAGERIVQNLDWFDGQLIDAPSMVPAIDGDTLTETCGPTAIAGRHYINTLNAIHGSAPTSQIYDYTPSTFVEGNPKTASRIEAALRYGLRTDTRIIGVCPSGQACDNRRRPGSVSVRASWRQLQ